MTPLLAATLGGPCDLYAELWTLCGPADGAHVTILDPAQMEPAWSGPLEPGGVLCARGVPPGTYEVYIDPVEVPTCGVSVDLDDVAVPGRLPSALPFPGLPRSQGDDLSGLLRLDRRVGRRLGGQGVLAGCEIPRTDPLDRFDPKNHAWHVTVTHLSGRSVQQGLLCWTGGEDFGQWRRAARRPKAPPARHTEPLDASTWASLAREISRSEILLRPPREDRPRADDLWVVVVHSTRPGYLNVHYLQPDEIAPWMRRVVGE